MLVHTKKQGTLEGIRRLSEKHQAGSEEIYINWQCMLWAGLWVRKGDQLDPSVVALETKDRIAKASHSY